LHLLAGSLQVVTTIVVTTGVIAYTHASVAVAIVVGMATALSSTAVVVRVLTDTTQADSQFGLAAIGVLLMQDLLLIPCLLLIPDLGSSARPVAIALILLVSLGKIAALALTMFLVQRLVLSRLLNLVASASAREELLVIASVIIAFGAAWVTHAMDLSAELGAFMAGLMIASEAYADHVRAEINPLKIVLVTLFFSVIGMLADARFIADNLMLIGELVLIVVVGKTVIAAGALRIAGSAAHVVTAGRRCARTDGRVQLCAGDQCIHSWYPQPVPVPAGPVSVTRDADPDPRIAALRQSHRRARWRRPHHGRRCRDRQ